MERSRTQALFSYLPGTVYIHETGIAARTHSVSGPEISGSLNKTVLLREIDSYLRGWDASQRVKLPMPSEVAAEEFRIISPELIRWEIWPLVFECSNDHCGRIASFRRADDVSRAAKCDDCGGRLRQLRYFSAHACGATRPMFTPKCTVAEHGYKHVYFEDTGSFRTSVFRCRACGGAVIRRTLQSPCGCRDFQEADGPPMMRAFTIQDTRTFYLHYVTLINFQSTLFNQLQRHPARGRMVLGLRLGLATRVGSALEEADRGGSGSGRLSQEEWNKRKAELEAMGLSSTEVEAIGASLGPAGGGLPGEATISPKVDSLCQQLRLLEWAMLTDRSEVKRFTLDEARDMALERSEATAAAAIESARVRGEQLGIEEIAVTWQFPIATAAFGFTRTVKKHGAGRIQGFAQPRQYDGKTPIFGVATDTEAVIVQLSASRVLRWLTQRGVGPEDGADCTENDARLRILEIFAGAEGDPEPAELVSTLLHSMSHALLRSLDDGQVGFAEASLAEWIVPETLTFALYANNLKSYTLGALWTLLNNRSLQWLNRAFEGAWICENDPLCHQRHPRACERCLYVSFGCRLFNEGLSRAILQEFWGRA